MYFHSIQRRVSSSIELPFNFFFIVECEGEKNAQKEMFEPLERLLNCLISYLYKKKI